MIQYVPDNYKSISEFCERCGYQKDEDHMYSRFCEDCIEDWAEENGVYLQEVIGWQQLKNVLYVVRSYPQLIYVTSILLMVIIVIAVLTK